MFSFQLKNNHCLLEAHCNYNFTDDYNPIDALMIFTIYSEEMKDPVTQPLLSGKSA